MTVIDLMDDLFARWFRGDSWFAWRVLLKVIFGLRLDDAEFAVFRAATGRTRLFLRPPTQVWIQAGRRAGKTLISALIAVFLACFRSYAAFVAPGEVVTIMLVAADRKQARTLMRYVKAFILQTALLAAMVVRVTKDSVELSNNVIIEIHTCSNVSTRSYTCGGCLNDEVAFWDVNEGSANPDTSVLLAQAPALATIPGALMVNASTPYSFHGAMANAFREHWGKDDSDVLFWKAPSRALEAGAVEMNPSLDISIVRRAYELDAIAAAAEWGAEFRSDVESYITAEALDAVTDPELPELIPYVEEVTP